MADENELLPPPPPKKSGGNADVESGEDVLLPPPPKKKISDTTGTSSETSSQDKFEFKFGEPTEVATPKTVTTGTAGESIQETKPVDTSSGLAKDVVNSFKAGSARLGASLARTPSFLYDLAATPQNIVAKYTGIPIGTSAAEFGKTIGVPDNKIAEWYDKAIVDTKQKIDQKYDKGITDYIAAGDYSKAFGLLANQIAESAPVSISLALGNAGGLSAAESILGGGAVFAAEKKKEIDESGANLDEVSKTGVALSNGLLEGIFEQFGITKLGGIAKDVLAKEGKEKALEVARKGFMDAYMPVAKKYLGVAAEEGLSEAATQFAQNAVDKYSGYKPDLDLREGVADAAIVGIGSGVAMSSPVAVIEMIKTPVNKAKAEGLINKKQSIEADIANPNIPESVRTDLSSVAQSINSDIADIQKADKEVFDSLSDEQKKEAETASKKLSDIDKSLSDPSLSQTSRDLLEVEKKKEEAVIENIYSPKPKTDEQQTENTPTSEGRMLHLDERAKFIQDKIDQLPQKTKEGIEIATKIYGEIFDSQQQTKNVVSEEGAKILDEATAEAAKLTGEVEPLKTEENAIQKRSTEKLDVRQPPGDSETVVEGISQSEGPSTTRSGQEERQAEVEKTVNRPKRAEDLMIEEGFVPLTQDEAYQYVAEKSEDPVEIINAYRQAAPESKKSYKEQIMDEYPFKVNKESFRRFGDVNVIGSEMATRFFSKESTPKTSIDTIAQNLSEISGVEITPQDIVDYMISSKYERKISDTQRKLMARFREITGLPFSDKSMNKILREASEREKVDFEKYLNKEATDYETAEQQYLDAIRKGEIPVTDDEQVSTTGSAPEVQAGETKEVKSDEDEKGGYNVVKNSLFPKLTDKLSKLFDAVGKIYYPEFHMRKTAGEEASAKTMTSLFTPDVVMSEFKETFIEDADMTVGELEEYFRKNYSNQDLTDANLAYGEPVFDEGKKIKELAIERLEQTDKGRELLYFNEKIRKKISDRVFELAQQFGFDDIQYFKDYFYGAYEGKEGTKDIIFEQLRKQQLEQEKFYKSTERFLKEKTISSPADALSVGLPLKDINPISNLAKEAYAIGKRASMVSIKNDILDNNRPYATTLNNADPKVHEDWVAINDPVFDGFLFHPDFARVVNNFIEVNAFSKNKFTRAIRGIVMASQAIKFFGSAFHLYNELKASIAAGGIKGATDFFKSLSKKIVKTDPLYKVWVQHGGGIHYSKETETIKKFSEAYDNVMKTALFNNPAAQAIGVPLKFIMGKYNPVSPAFAKAMFNDWIPAMKFERFKKDKAEQEKKLGRPLKSSEIITLVKRTQEFYGEMNEKLYGRSGNITALMRLIFMAPGYGEGNFLHQYRAVKEVGGLAKAAQKGEAKKQLNEVGVKNTAFVINSMLTTAVLATIGTMIMTGEAPDPPEDANGIRDLFKIKTGMKDGSGNDLYIDMMTYDKDAWMLFGNLATGQLGKGFEELPARIQGMAAAPLKIAIETATILLGGTVVDYKKEPIYNETDDLHTKFWKFIAHQAKKAEPISFSTFKQQTEKGVTPVAAAAQSVVGFRPTTSESVKETKKAARDEFGLQKAKIIEQKRLNALYADNPKEALDQAREFNEKQEQNLIHLIKKEYENVNKEEAPDAYVNKKMKKFDNKVYFINQLSTRERKGGTKLNVKEARYGGKPRKVKGN